MIIDRRRKAEIIGDATWATTCNLQLVSRNLTKGVI